MQRDLGVRTHRFLVLLFLAGAATAVVGRAGVAAADEAVQPDVEIGDALVIERDQPVGPDPVGSEPVGSEPVAGGAPEIGDALVIEREQPVEAAPVEVEPVAIGEALVIEREQPVDVPADGHVPGAPVDEAPVGEEPVEPQPSDDGVEIGDALVIEREQPPEAVAPSFGEADRPGRPTASTRATSTDVLGVQHTRLAATGAGPLGQVLAGSALLLVGAAVCGATRRTQRA